MPKNKGKNSFFYFMIDTQNQLKREGKNYSINDQRLQKLAGDRWKVMNADERAPYEEKSRIAKQQSANNAVIEVTPKTYNERARDTNFGRVMAEEDAKMDDERNRYEYADKMVQSCVNASKIGDIITASFFIIGTNVMLRTDDNVYPPMEISITQYSIKEGIHYTYHRFVDPGPIPFGYARLALEFARDFHKIPLQNFYPAINDYNKIVEEITEILEKSRFTNIHNNRPTPMIVFCREEQMDQTKGVLEWLATKYRSVVPHFEWDIEILDLVSLLYYLSVERDEPIVPAIGEERLNSSAFDYSLNTNCSFHDEQENRHCAQGLVRRLCYMMSDSLCPIFKVTPTENHLPPSRISVAEKYYPSFNDTKIRPNRLADASAAMSDTSSNFEFADSRPQSRTNQVMAMGIGRGRGVPPRQ